MHRKSYWEGHSNERNFPVLYFSQLTTGNDVFSSLLNCISTASSTPPTPARQAEKNGVPVHVTKNLTGTQTQATQFPVR